MHPCRTCKEVRDERSQASRLPWLQAITTCSKLHFCSLWTLHFLPRSFFFLRRREKKIAVFFSLLYFVYPLPHLQLSISVHSVSFSVFLGRFLSAEREKYSSFLYSVPQREIRRYIRTLVGVLCIDLSQMCGWNLLRRSKHSPERGPQVISYGMTPDCSQADILEERDNFTECISSWNNVYCNCVCSSLQCKKQAGGRT